LVSRPPPTPAHALPAQRHSLPPSNTRWVISAVALAAVLIGAAFLYRSISGGSKRAPQGEIGQAAEGAGKAGAPAPDHATAPQVDTMIEDEPAPADLDLTVEGKKDAERLIAEGRELEQSGKRTQAMALYDRALAITPNDPELLSRMAFNHLNRGDNKSAEDFAARAAAVDPTSSEAWIVLGAARDGQGNRTGARDAYKRCVELGRGDYVEECRRMLR